MDIENTGCLAALEIPASLFHLNVTSFSTDPSK